MVGTLATLPLTDTGKTVPATCDQPITDARDKFSTSFTQDFSGPLTPLRHGMCQKQQQWLPMQVCTACQILNSKGMPEYEKLILLQV